MDTNTAYKQGTLRSQKALIASSLGVLTLSKTVPVPDIEGDEILVKVKAVALNPSDWKLLEDSCTPGAISGCDFAGTIVSIGRDVHRPFRVNDRVFGFVFGSNPSRPGNGAFAEYVAATGDLCLPIPDLMSFEEAASLGAGTMSVGLAFRSLGIISVLKPNLPSILHSERRYALVYGGSTATGTLAIQLFCIHGFLPITTCSPHNFDLVKSVGAVQAFDYHSDRCKEEIRTWTKGRLAIVLDCITTSKSTSICYGALGDDGGRYTALESIPPRLKLRRKDVRPDWILGWTAFGKAVELGGKYRREASQEDRVFAENWMNRVDCNLKNGKLKPHPICVLGGLDDIIPGVEKLRKGEVTGFKQVYTIE
jgi:aspyridone synthetase trans-acting enoyl reductase